jgi:hypothetical protein
MAQTQNPKTPQTQTQTVFSLLSEKEQKKLLILLSKADKYRSQYIKSLEEILELLEDVEKNYDYIYEETGKHAEELDALIRIMDNLKSLIYSILSPYAILSKAEEEN